jgi:hypothetical protein
LLPCTWWATEALDRADVREWIEILSSCVSPAASSTSSWTAGLTWCWSVRWRLCPGTSSSSQYTKRPSPRPFLLSALYRFFESLDFGDVCHLLIKTAQRFVVVDVICDVV